MKKVTHETKGRVLETRAFGDRAPYCLPNEKTLIQMDFLDGGAGHFILPGNASDWVTALAHRIEISVKLEFSVPDRVDMLDTILRDKGVGSALDYARRELAK